jgi:hypothetical protein
MASSIMTEMIFGNHLIVKQLDPEALAVLAAECIAKFNQISRLHFSRSPLPSVLGQDRHSLFMGQVVLGRHTCTTPFALTFAHRRRLCCVLPPQGLLPSFLQGGSTAHSWFKIPILCHESSICSVPKNTLLAELILETVLVIWDEAPMQHRHIMKAVDWTFQDVRSCSQLFGGVTFVFGGDFQQILPVIPGSSRGQTVGACIQRSILWRSITVVYLLHQNM